MPCEEDSSGSEDVIETLDEALLRGFVEIDHDIAAEDEIERAGEGPGIHEIKVGEAHHVADVRGGLDGVGALVAGEEVMLVNRRHGVGAAAVVEAFAGGAEDPVGNVGARTRAVMPAPDLSKKSARTMAME